MVDPAYYKDSWHGSFDGSEEELRILLSRAADAVNIAITMSGYTVHTVPDMVAENVKRPSAHRRIILKHRAAFPAWQMRGASFLLRSENSAISPVRPAAQRAACFAVLHTST